MNTVATTPATLDLTGLPEAVVRQLHRLAAHARPEECGPSGVPDPAPTPRFVSRPNLTPEEWERALDEMASMSSGQALPLDFSRADIYDDHD